MEPRGTDSMMGWMLMAFMMMSTSGGKNFDFSKRSATQVQKTLPLSLPLRTGDTLQSAVT